ncbi:MAG: hypothetical protein LBT97_14220 [Planctomycetota bacterium]|jgi:hypothetical protein|nr:hypothetical protein [Planctomycetota bacterium]
MIRVIRRTVRGWKRELLSFYGRFNTFHRMVVGIILAMGMVYCSRRFLLDPGRKDMRAIENRLKEDSVPDVVPQIDTDKELQDALLRAETREKQLAEFQERLAAAEAGSRFNLDASPSDADAALYALAISCGLRVHQTGPVAASEPAKGSEKETANQPAAKGGGKGRKAAASEPEAEPPKPAEAALSGAAAKDYELRGDFASIRAFFRKAAELPYLMRIEKIAFGVVYGEENEPLLMASGRPLLSLSFRALMFRYEKEADGGRNRS